MIFYMILGWLSLSVGILFTGAILFLALFNNYNISFFDYLETNQQIFTNGFILIAIGIYIISVASKKLEGRES